MYQLRVAVSVAGLLTLASALAQSQEPDTLSAAQRAGLALARLGGGQRVRIHSSGVGIVKGLVVRSSPSSVTLRMYDRSMIDVSAPTVDSLWVAHGTHAGRGALIGAAVGGVALGTVAAVACQGGKYCNDPSTAVLLGVAVGAVPGSLIGALIGAAAPRWQLRVP